MLYSPILSVLRILPLIFWVIICLTTHFFNAFIFKRDFFIFYNLFFKVLVSIFGIKVKISGKIEFAENLGEKVGKILKEKSNNSYKK